MPVSVERGRLLLSARSKNSISISSLQTYPSIRSDQEGKSLLSSAKW